MRHDEPPSPLKRERVPSRSTSLLSSVTTVAAGTALAQLIFVAATPVIARLFSPDSFGAFASFQSAATVLALIATGRYESAIPLPAQREDAERVLRLSLIIAVASSIAVMIVSLALASTIDVFTGVMPVALLSLTVFAIAAFSTFTQYFAREGHFRLLSVTRVTRASVTTLVQLLLGASDVGGTVALAIGLTAGYLISSTMLVVAWRRSSGPVPRGDLDRVFRTYLRFPQFSAPAAGLTALGTTAIPALLALAHNVTVAGYYGLASRVLQLPVQLLGHAIGQVIYPTFARQLAQGRRIREPLLLTTSALLRISAAVFSWLIVFGDLAFAYVFGGAWVEAGEYAEILSIWMLGSFVSGPLSQIPLAYKRNRTTLAISAVETTSRLAVVAVGAVLESAAVTIYGLALSGLVITIFHTRWTLRLGGVSMGALVRANLPYAALVAALAAVSHLLRSVLANEVMVAALSLVIFALVGAVSATRAGRRIAEVLR